MRGWTGGSGNGNAGDAGDTCDWPAAGQWRARTSVTAPVTVEQRDRRHCGWPTSRLQAQARRQSIQPLPRQNGGHCSWSRNQSLQFCFSNKTEIASRKFLSVSKYSFQVGTVAYSFCTTEYFVTIVIYLFVILLYTKIFICSFICCCTN